MKARAPAAGGPRLRDPRSSPVAGPRVRLLVVDGDPAVVASIRDMVRPENWAVAGAETGAAALRRARDERPDAILTELDLRDMTGADLCRALREQGETAGIPVIVLSAREGVSERVASLRAGASDYLVKPPDAPELLARLKAALDLREEKTGFVVAVIGAKGGVGASVVAVNVAVALRRQARAPVALLDATSGGAAAASIMLNLQAAHRADRLLPRLGDLEPNEFEAVLARHPSGVQALLLEEHSAQAAEPEELHRVLVALRRMHGFVVVDAPPLFASSAAPVFELADCALLVLTPEITALRGAKAALDRMAQKGLGPERIAVVLNRFPLRGGLQRAAVERTLGAAVQATIPDDVNLVAYSINRGTPIVESHRRSGVSRHLGMLAATLAKAAHDGSAVPHPGRRQIGGARWVVH